MAGRRGGSSPRRASREFAPVAEAAADQILSLPMHPHLTEAMQDRVVEVLASAVASHPGRVVDGGRS